jgi:hypothetical protein
MKRIVLPVPPVSKILYGKKNVTNQFKMLWFQAQSSSTRNMERKRSTAEKNINLSVLQKYFSGSLKDAAKSLGGK